MMSITVRLMCRLAVSIKATPDAAPSKEANNGTRPQRTSFAIAGIPLPAAWRCTCVSSCRGTPRLFART
jgi:hypothetical protein